MKPLAIAITEDDWFIADYLCRELTALGHVIVARARTGERLINLVARERPDLVLVDIQLAEGSDGLAAAKEIQERHSGDRRHRTTPRRGRRSSGTVGPPQQAIYGAHLASGPRGGGSMAEGRIE
jgi:CheY-like chemotaxis protein